MRMVFFGLLLCVAGASPVGAASAARPAPDDSVLAIFDGGSVYPSEFARAWGGTLPVQRPEGDPIPARLEFLTRIVDRKLLAREALARPFTMTAAETLDYLRTVDLQLQNALLRHLEAQEPPPAPQDLDLIRRQNGELAEIRFVTFPDSASARAWRVRLASGTPIAALDRAIAAGGPKAPTADSMRFVAAEAIPDTLARIIWRMRPGQLSEVYSFAGHSTAIQVRRFQVRIAPIDVDDTVELERVFRSKRLAELRERYRAQVKSEIVVRYEEPAMELLLARHLEIPPRTSTDSLSGIPTFRATIPLPRFDPADTSRVLAFLQGRPMTIGGYLDFWGYQPGLSRPEVRNRAALEAAVDRPLLAPELVRRARKMGLERDSVVVATLARRRESFALDHYYRDEIQAKVPMDEARIRAFYEKDRERYDDKPTIEAHILMVDRKPLADSLLARIRAGEKFEDLAREYSMHGETGAEGGRAGTIVRGTNPNAGLEDAMFATASGQLGGPERTPEGWVIWRIDRSYPGIKRTFDLARDWAVRDYRIVEGERILNENLARLRDGAHVQVFADRITPYLGDH
ncbi:MAG: peptidylprolyl isomerase [Candidatus Eiseniibacteriota bacterium]